MAASSSQGWDQYIEVNFAQGPALRAPHTKHLYNINFVQRRRPAQRIQRWTNIV